MSVGFERGIWSTVLGLGGAGALALLPDNQIIGFALIGAALCLAIWGLRINGRAWWRQPSLLEAHQPARVKIDSATFTHDPENPVYRKISLVVKNGGPGIAYLGNPGLAFKFMDNDDEFPNSDIDAMFAGVVQELHTVTLEKRVVVESGEVAPYTMKACMLDED